MVNVKPDIWGLGNGLYLPFAFHPLNILLFQSTAIPKDGRYEVDEEDVVIAIKKRIIWIIAKLAKSHVQPLRLGGYTLTRGEAHQGAIR